MAHYVRGLWRLVLAVAVTATPVVAQGPPTPQEGSEIGNLILSLTTTDGRPIVGTRVVLDGAREGSPADLRTDDGGTVEIPGDAFAPGTGVSVSARVGYSLSARAGDPLLSMRGAYRDDAALLVDEVLIGEDDGDRVDPSLASASYLWATGRSRGVQWGRPTRIDVRVDTDCATLDGVTPDRPEASGVVTMRSLFPEYLFPEEEAMRDREVDFFQPLLLQFPDDLGRSTVARDLVCGEPDGDLPELAVYGLHGFNLDFDDGAWGARGTVPLPFFRERNLGGALGIDFYPQDDVRSTLAVNADLTCSFPWDALGDASAFVGVGPRVYVQLFDSGGASSSDTEVGVGAVSGMTYGVGPVTLYGDVGLDRAYGSFLPVTHVGVGVAFGGD